MFATSGYTGLCRLSIATIALALGLLLPNGAEALGCTVAFVVVASILNGQAAFHAVSVILPVHYRQNWTRLFTASGHADLTGGVLCQLVTIALATGVAFLVLRLRDPAA